MTTFWKPPVYGVEGRIVQWLNNTVQGHDMICGCDTPVQHLIFEFAKRSSHYGLTAENLNNMTKCLTFTEEKDTQTDSTSEEEHDGGPEGDLTFGDLDKLFEGDDPFTADATG